jgi:hypothetical protein
MLNTKTLIYQSQKLKVRALRVFEAIEHLIGARPGEKLMVNFRASSLEEMVHRTGRRLSLGLTAAASMLASGLTVMATGVAEWVPITFGVVAGLLTVGLVFDILRGRYAMTIIAKPTSQRSTCRMNGLLGIVFVDTLFRIRVSSIEGLRSTTNNLLRVPQFILPVTGRNIHHRLYP